MSTKKKQEESLQINKNGDVIYHTADEFFKAVLSFIPLGIIADSFLNFQGNLKRRRVIEFSESLKKVLESLGGRELHANDFNNEDFVDIMESVYKRVQNTKSDYKLERFKNILTQQIIQRPNDYELTLKYVSLVSTLADIQIVILNKMRTHSSGVFSDMRTAIIPGATLKETRDNEEVIIDVDDYKGSFIKADLMLYCKELVSFGLVNESLKTEMTHGGGNTRKRYSISNAGISFLKFIETT